MIYKTLSSAITFFTLFILSLPTSATEKGFYGGLTISQFEAEEQGITSSEKGLGIIAGYTFNRYIDLEASVFDAGDHNDLGMKAEGVSLSVVGKYDINADWQLFAEFGGVSFCMNCISVKKIVLFMSENTHISGFFRSKVEGE